MKTALQNKISSGKQAERKEANDTVKNNGKITKGKDRGLLLENLLIRACSIALTILIMSQALLSVTSIRTAIFNEGADGEPLGSEAYAYIPCKLELTLVNIDECPELKILVNGEKIEAFQGKSVLLDLKDGDVVELDASEVLAPTAVQVSAASRNLETLLGKTINAAGGLVMVATVKTGN